MASKLAHAHIQAQQHLRSILATAVGDIWNGLPGYDRANVDEWLSRVVPLVTAGQRQSTALTDAFLAQATGRGPLGVAPAPIRAGTQPDVVYQRPFVTVWSALQAGTAWDQAVADGLARAKATAATDVQLVMRATSQAVQNADDGIFGFQRVADGGACQFCALLDGAFVKSADAAAMHPACGCGLEPLTRHHPHAATLPSGVAVHDHGELGAYLADPAHDFTAESDL